MLDASALTDAVQNLCHMYTAFSPFGPMDTFLHLLNKSRRLKSSDPRDKVFAFLSHPTACTMSISGHIPRNMDSHKDYIDIAIQLLPSIQNRYLARLLQEKAEERKAISVDERKLVPLIEADYHKTVQEVYQDVALEHIKRTVFLEVLTAVQHDCDATVDLPFPSWVPQWNKCNETQPLGFVTSKHFASANGDAIVTPLADTDPDTIIARGTIVSNVVYTSSLCQSSSFDWALRPDDDLTASANSVADTWLKTKLYLAKYIRADCDIFMAYMRTWVAGKNLSEVDGFDLENDVTAYWYCLWANPTEGTRNYSENYLIRRAERYRASAAAIAD